MIKVGIDIGTNTLLCLIAEVKEGKMRVLADEHRIARLGEGVDRTGIINPTSLDRALKILSEYRDLISHHPGAKVFAVTTSGMRDARNRTEVLMEMQRALGHPISIISGNEEASLTFLGSREHYECCSLLDIGGGSTEVSSGTQAGVDHVVSLDFGSVRWSEKYFSSLPPTASEIQSAKAELLSVLSSVTFQPFLPFIAVAGTPTSLMAYQLGLAAFDPSRVHMQKITLLEIQSLFKVLSKMSESELTAQPALHPKRAALMPMGALILMTIMEHFSLEDVIVSTKGLRYGLVLS